MPDHTPNTLKFIIGEESTPVIEGVDRYDTSIFKAVYDKVFASIFDFLPEDASKSKQVELNNIFVFAGERGTGKSSCMQSVVKMLTEERQKVLGKIDRSDTKCGSFMAMDLVDPGLFEQDNNLLQLVVGKMFRAFKEQVENELRGANNKLDQQSKKRDLVDSFEKIYRNIRTLFNKNEVSNESLDALLDLSASYDLRENFKKLVGGYLEFMSPEKEVAQQLIIPIDDIDLQTEHAYAMVEQIRKYMMHDNILIFMAVRIGQLEDVVAKQYITEFQLSLNQCVMEKEEPIEMSERYVAKLIPQQRRFFLPLMETSFETILNVEKDGAIDEGCSKLTVREAVLALIYRKTRFLFYNSKGVTSYIVPRNLRELRNLIRLLYDMDDYRIYNIQGEVERKNDYNKVLFQRYFMDSWLKNNLKSTDCQIIRDIWGSEVILKNKVTVDFLKGLIQNLFSRNRYPYDESRPLRDRERARERSAVEAAIQNIVLGSSKAYDISLGDVFGLLDIVDKHYVDPKHQKLTFAIRTIYSMFLYKYYDELTDKKNESHPRAQETLKHSMLEEESSYVKLIAGSYINTFLYDLMPDYRNGSSRINFTIDTSNVIKQFEVFFDKQREKKKLNESDVTRLNVLEFIILCIAGREEDKKADLRSIGNPSYKYNVTAQTTKFTFDVLAFLFNLVEIDKTYMRFSEWYGKHGESSDSKNSLLGLVQTEPGSLYNKIRNRASIYTSYESMVCFRNADVLSSFVFYMVAQRPTSKGGNITLYRKFYDDLSQFSIQTYDGFEIKFDFIQEFALLFDDKNVAFFRETFNWPISNFNIDAARAVPSGYPVKIPKVVLNGKESKTTSETLLARIEKKFPLIDFSVIRDILDQKAAYTHSEGIELLSKIETVING